MNSIIEVLCLGFDPSGLGVGTRPQLSDQELEFSVAMDRPSVRQAFARPERWDLILCRSTAYYDLGIDRWLAETAGALLAPMILVRPPATQLSPAEAAKRGAADIVNHGDREHLEMVMARELASLRLRRELHQRNDGGPRTSVVLPLISDYGRSALQTHAGDHSDTDAESTHGTETSNLEGQTTFGDLVPPEMDDQRVKDLIEQGGLTLEYQPIVALHQEDTRAGMFEALLRLRGEDGRLLPPGRFFPAAGRHRWLGRMDLWVLRRALPILARMQASAAEQTRLFINLSAETLAVPQVVDAVLETIAASKIRPGSLTLEVQRSALMQESEALSRLRTTMQQGKHGILMEQFNAGDCDLLRDNLGWVTHVKLDKPLILGLATGHIHREAVQKVIRCARNNGVKIIALAVDNAEILPDLYALGVDYIQGHFVSMPYEELVYPDVFNIELEPK